MPVLAPLPEGAVVELSGDGVGVRFDSGRLEPLPSLHALEEFAWVVFPLDGTWRLHVSRGVELRRNGGQTGGGALRHGDVLDGAFRYLDGEWPGRRRDDLDAATLVAPDDDALALVYRDWALLVGSPISESLRRPVPRDEQARHLFSLAREVAAGRVEAQFAGPFVRRVVLRDPSLDLDELVEALAACMPGLKHCTRLRAVGWSASTLEALVKRVTRTAALAGLADVEAGQRGAFSLEALRAPGSLSEGLPRPAPGPAAPAQLELVAWDGWTSVAPLTTERFVRLDGDVSLVAVDDGAALRPFSAQAPVSLLRRDDWVLQVGEGVGPALRPSVGGVPFVGRRGLLFREVFELVPGLSCRLRPEVRREPSPTPPT